MSGHVVVKVPGWLARREGYASTELEGEVLRETDRAILLRGSAVVRESDRCLRCGREITNPVSRLAGYGPWCSDELGIPRDFSEDEVEQIREAVKVRTRVEVWLPRSRVTFVEGAPNGAGPRLSERASLALDGDRIVCRSPFRFKDAVKAVPGRRWDKERKAWTFPASDHAATALAALLDGVETDVDDGVRALLGDAARRDEAQGSKARDDLPDVPHSRTVAWRHQRQAFWFARELQASMLAMDMGTGKSKVAVDLACEWGSSTVLILCPKSVLGVWPREFALHADCDVRVLAERKGTLKRRAARVAAELARPFDGITVVVVNYEAAWRSAWADVLTSRPWSLVILDESHRVKKPGGRASLFCARLRPLARRRLCLTGTPMPHSPLDVYAQYRFLDPGIFGTSFTAFRSRYAVMGGYGGHEVLRFQRQDELAERMYRVGFRVMADDVLDLPEATHDRRECELSGKALETYVDLDDALYADVEEGTVTAANALVRLLRLQQVTSGWVPLDDPDEEGEREWVQVDTSKRDLLADVLEDVPTIEPVVVFCRFTRDLDNVREVCESQGRRYGELSGRRTDALAEDATMAAGVDVAGVQVQSGGVGIDLTRARYCVFYSLGFSLGDYEQAVRRVHRPGQERPVTFLHLAAEGTVDEKVYEALRQRRNVVEHVLGLSS